MSDAVNDRVAALEQVQANLAKVRENLATLQANLQPPPAAPDPYRHLSPGQAAFARNLELPR
jgi:hypothetical protein